MQFLLEQRRIHLKVSQRRRPIAAGCKRLHETGCGARARWIERSEASPPRHGPGAITAAIGVHGEPLKRVALLLLETRPLLFDPALELGRVGEIEPVQEWA